MPRTATANGPLFDFDHSEFEAALAADHANVEDTARTLTREQVEACVSALANAKRVVIVGVDQMAFFASYLRHLLALLDLRAEVVATPRQESINRLARVDEDTLVVAFSAGRAHPLIIRALKLAQHRRSPTLAISDATLSEIGEHADYQLYFSSNGPSYTRSNTALHVGGPGARLWRLLARQGLLQGQDPGLQAEVAEASSRRTDP